MLWSASSVINGRVNVRTLGHPPRRRDQSLHLSPCFAAEFFFPLAPTHHIMQTTKALIHLTSLRVLMFLTHCKKKCGFGKFCLWISPSFVLLPSITTPPRTATICWLSAFAKTTMTLWLWLCIKNTKCVRARRNAGLIKKSAAGYQCSTRALEISLVALVTARTDSGECQWVHTNVFAVGGGQRTLILSRCKLALILIFIGHATH